MGRKGEDDESIYLDYIAGFAGGHRVFLDRLFLVILEERQMNENETKAIAKLDKNTAEEIRFSFAEWHGKKYLDIRVWVKADPEEGKEEQPTKKGIRFSLELLDEFIGILQKINAGEAFGPEKPEGAEEKEAEGEEGIPF